MNGLFGKKKVNYEKILNAYGTDLKQLAYSYVKDRQLAEDITQETFIKCLTKRDTFKGNSSLKTWLFAIAINLSKDYLKNGYHRRVTVDNNVTEQQSFNAPSAESEALTNYENQNVTEYILDLPIEYREIIVLYYFKEFKVREIAETLKLSGNTVKTRMRRARELLKERMVRHE